MTNVTIFDQLRIVAEMGHRETTTALGLAVCSIMLIVSLALLIRFVWKLAKSHAKESGTAVAAILFALYGAAIGAGSNDSAKPEKIPSATIIFDRGLYDQGSVATNNWPEIRWKFDTWLRNDTAHISVCRKGEEETGWYDVWAGPVTATAWSGYVDDCTNMVIHIWSEYIPPPAEHTNGVYHLEYVTTPMDWDKPFPEWLLPRCQIIDANDRRLMSPPIIPEPLIIDFLNKYAEPINEETEDNQ